MSRIQYSTQPRWLKKLPISSPPPATFACLLFSFAGCCGLIGAAPGLIIVTLPVILACGVIAGKVRKNERALSEPREMENPSLLPHQLPANHTNGVKEGLIEVVLFRHALRFVLSVFCYLHAYAPCQRLKDSFSNVRCVLYLLSHFFITCVLFEHISVQCTPSYALHVYIPIPPGEEKT